MTSQTGWRNPLLFRDYLRSHPEPREEYKAIKERLAGEFADNRDEYTERKSDFVLDILKKARAELV